MNVQKLIDDATRMEEEIASHDQETAKTRNIPPPHFATAQEINVTLDKEVRRLWKVLEKIGDMTNHGIPFYAYGDNQAACEMADKLEEIAAETNNALENPFK